MSPRRSLTLPYRTAPPIGPAGRPGGRRGTGSPVQAPKVNHRAPAICCESRQVFRRMRQAWWIVVMPDGSPDDRADVAYSDNTVVVGDTSLVNTDRWRRFAPGRDLLSIFPSRAGPARNVAFPIPAGSVESYP